MANLLKVLGVAVALAAPVSPAVGPALALPAQMAEVDAARIARLTEAMRLAPLLAVVREEGLAYGDALDRDLLGGQGGVSWRAEVARVYDPKAALGAIEAQLQTRLAADPAVLAALEAFYAGPAGRKAADLEATARRALLDPAAKTLAQTAWDDLRRSDAVRADRLEALVAGQGLVDLNVQGALDANLALYHGLNEGGGLVPPMDEADMVAEVAGQEPQIRAASEDWLLPYLTLTCKPMSDPEFAQYLDFLSSPEGLRANQVMFGAFDALYMGFSHDLGLAAARRLAGQAI